MIFHGSKDKPYGYTIIDHTNKNVLKGGDVLKLKELLQFSSKEDRLHRMDEFIDAMLEDNPEMTTKELNRLLRHQQLTKESNNLHIQKPNITKEGSRAQNREWEVGRKGNYDEIDDERQLKR